VGYRPSPKWLGREPLGLLGGPKREIQGVIKFKQITFKARLSYQIDMLVKEKNLANKKHLEPHYHMHM